MTMLLVLPVASSLVAGAGAFLGFRGPLCATMLAISAAVVVAAI